MMKVLEKLGEAAHEAAEVEKAKRDSGREEHEARVAVLRTALEMVKIALLAIGTKTRFFGEEQYVALIGTRDRNQTATAQGCRWQLYVSSVGTLLEDERVWTGGAWLLVRMRVIGIEEAAELYAPEDIAARLLRHLTSAIEGRNLRRTADALLRAERYRALAALLESLGGDK